MYSDAGAAQDRLTVDASASIGAATNPYLQAGSTPTAISPTLDLHPSWVLEHPLTTIRVEGDVQATFYNQGYGTNTNATVQASGTQKLSPYTTLDASLGYFNSIVGTYDGFRIPNLPVTPIAGADSVGTVVPIGADLPGFVNDPALGGIGRRRQSYQAAGDIVSMLSPRDQISAGASLSLNRFDGAGFNDYTYVTPDIAYSRTLSANASVGINLSVGFTDYQRTPIGDATIYQPSVTATRKLTERLTLHALAGVAIVDLNEPFGRSRTTTTFSGSADLCRRDSWVTGCLTVSRQTVPSAYQGVRTTTAAALSFSDRLSATDNVSVDAGYSHAGTPLEQVVIGGVRDDAVDFLSVGGNYSHRFREKLSGFVSVGYVKAFDDLARRDGNLTGSVGVTYRFDGL